MGTGCSYTHVVVPAAVRREVSSPLATTVSPKIRRWASRPASARASSGPSASPTPSSTTIPWPICPVASPGSSGPDPDGRASTRTSARRTRCTSARIR